ncbi:hypothetical protein ACFWXH_31250 [Mesorhizobium sp. NPDC059054]|uniref:hypothetical protein n=1 Tax=Mesorhizobium sp. NPDC059054 TaxID=3346711 RepID=UPI0036B845E9
MPKVLYDLHQGHAPITLHQAFQDATDTLEGDGDTQEPAVFVEGCAVPVTTIFGAMLECTDLMPFRTRESVNVVLAAARESASTDSGDIYARGARLMLSYCRQRFGKIPSPGCPEHDPEKLQTFPAEIMRQNQGVERNAISLDRIPLDTGDLPQLASN